MAFQTRGGDPLFDSEMQATIERRGKELAGLVLIVAGLMAVMLIGSYTPDDPSWMSAHDAPVQNWLGRFGAAIAAPLYMVIGAGSWGVAIVILAWGLRLTLHTGTERAIGRLIFAPIWIALLSVYASTMVPDQDWSHRFGMGGLFGDTVLGTTLGIAPVGPSFALKMVALVLGPPVIALGLFVTGFSALELKRIGQYLLVGIIMIYAFVSRLLGRGAVGALQTAAQLQARHRDRRDRRRAEAAEMRMNAGHDASAYQWSDSEEEHWAAPEPTPRAPERGGFIGRLPSLMRRAEAEPLPQPELVEPQPVRPEPAAPGNDRIKARIAEIVRSRTGTAEEGAPPAPADKPLTRGRGHGPRPLVFDTPATPARAEPPLTAPAPRRAEEPPLTARQPADEPQPPVESAYPQDEAAMFEDGRFEDDFGDDHVEDGAMAPEPQPRPAQPIPAAQPRQSVVQHAARKSIVPSTRAQLEQQPSLQFEENAVDYELPPLSLLSDPRHVERHHLSDEALEENARMLENVLDDYGVKGEIVSVRPGPVVTMYELEPAPGLKASRVIGLADDIARSMSALSARVSTVPGRSVIGIELPNEKREMVSFREILSAREYGDGNQKLPLALGKDIGGDPMVANLAKMPHLLIAGTTGSGKSVAINTMILSLLYKLTPEDLRLVMIDPKMLELSVYDGIPHLLSPVVTDPKKAVVALKWVVGEMEERYRKMSKMGVRNIDGYNSRVADAQSRNEMFSRTVQTGFDDDTGEPVFETEEFNPERMPYIVVIVDEMADLMMVAGKEIEACIQRLAQMARASGIHLIMATQRPSVDVITGTIKANFPTRISFQVTSKIDSRTILGEMGAEQLLGMGDMLYMAGGARITRCHGPFVSDEEVEEVVNHLKAFGPPSYVGGVVEGPDEGKADDIDAVLGLNTGGNTDGEDALYDQAVAIVAKDRKCSTSYIQRKLGIGYNKAARLVEQMEDNGLVTPANHVGKREILVPEQG
ncbi:FtsK/SpoIIIE family protein [Pseudooceanicola batsensis HTCC2597]|uniref:DNA translocase FtsK n=1 Tax=Pseudooceanicola batsensis (strain ATCC BAA-863 / DSM 15984 / KCTC 12145 / HTCC2597) TaxID=252305 RepID=A3TWH5_PSEBH|nr:DNA translocase FtsK [Pseudooceanicola batsensis]EAQ03971.1 FtsK/SpoIIIE family protein [Pseudooceanicola batsensis HTCC2597]